MAVDVDREYTEEELAQQETWEIQVKGGVSLWKKNRRTNEYARVKANGHRGPKRLTLTVDDRLYNEELIPDEAEHLNPFTNGTLALVKGRSLVGDLTTEKIREYLALDDEEVFREAVQEMDLELTVRRLKEMADQDGKIWQVEIVRDVLEQNWPIGGTQPTVMEMLRESEDGGTQLTPG